MSFLKAPGYEDGHAGYSDPTDEQQFVVNEINALEQTPDWRSTVVIVDWDDSDGFYDHVYSGVTNPSLSRADNDLTTHAPRKCENRARTVPAAGRRTGSLRLRTADPLLVISPYAK